MKTLDHYKKIDRHQRTSKNWLFVSGFFCGALFWLTLELFVAEMVRSAI